MSLSWIYLWCLFDYFRISSAKLILVSGCGSGGLAALLHGWRALKYSWIIIHWHNNHPILFKICCFHSRIMWLFRSRFWFTKAILHAWFCPGLSQIFFIIIKCHPLPINSIRSVHTRDMNAVQAFTVIIDVLSIILLSCRSWLHACMRWVMLLQWTTLLLRFRELWSKHCRWADIF